MRHHADVVDVGVEVPGPDASHAEGGTHPSLRHGRLVTTWRQSRLTDFYCRRVITRAAARHGCDVVLEIQDLAIIDRPFFLYQD